MSRLSEVKVCTKTENFVRKVSNVRNAHNDDDDAEDSSY